MSYLKLAYEPYTLYFKFDAGTSRGIMRERKVWFLHLASPDNPDVVGKGEVAPLEGLSVDDIPNMDAILQDLCEKVAETDFNFADLHTWVNKLVPPTLPAVRFGLETAAHDWANGGKGIIWHKDFAKGKQRITTNGLIWMGSPDFMQSQIEEKLQKGYKCLKLKIGALDFEQELAILRHIRARYKADEITLRVDANGAFLPIDALEKLKRLSEFDIHSIEQPIKAGQIDEMARLCALSPLPIALDEELIGVYDIAQQQKLLEIIKPDYVIMKPSLLGGILSCVTLWRHLKDLGIQWWMTSALESNIGLNAICQLTAFLFELEQQKGGTNLLPQGLGTGGLYHNNIPSALCMEGEDIFCTL